MNNESHWYDLPIITCPYCDKEFQVDDYQNLESGDEIVCIYCMDDIVIKQAEWILTVEISRKESE